MKRSPAGIPAGLRVCGWELVPIRPCGASGAARDPRGPAQRSKARGRAAQLIAGWPPQRTPLPREAAWRGAPHPATRVFCGAGGRKRTEGRKPRVARQGPNRQGTALRPHLAACTGAKRCAPDHAAKFRFAPQLPVGPCAGRLRRPALAALQKIRPPAPQIAPLRALPRASRGAHGSGRRWGAFSRFSRGAKTKARRGIPPGFVLLVVELVPTTPCGASEAARDPRGLAQPWKARGRVSRWRWPESRK